MNISRELNHDLSLKLNDSIEQHPLKKILPPIENHDLIKQKRWTSEANKSHTTGGKNH